MRHKNCIFFEEADCAKEYLEFTCEECEENKHYETIKEALDDFIALGDSFSALFLMLKKLLDEKDKTVDIEIPVDKITIINRVMTAFLTTEKSRSEKDLMYRRLIYFFFKVTGEDFELQSQDEDTKMEQLN